MLSVGGKPHWAKVNLNLLEFAVICFDYAIFSSDLNLVIKTRSKLTLHPVAFPPTKLQT